MIEYIQDRYNTTKFPFFSVIEMKNKGVFDLELANLFLTQNKIRKRKGFHGTLIEILEEKLVNGKLILD